MSKQAGFTAVELLITLFVAAAFLIAGYQLFNVVIRDGGQARAESSAANVAYDYMRQYAPQAPNPCANATVLSDVPITVEGLTNAKISIAFTCPSNMPTPGLTKIQATIKYNIPEQTLTYSTFTNGIAGLAPADVTNGIINWWKFNGNGNQSSGDTPVAITGATLRTGQNGTANSAYNFNGTTTQYGTVNSTFGLDNLNGTLSVWVNSATATNSGLFIKTGVTNGYGIGVGNVTFDNNSPGTKIVMLFEGVRWIVTTTNLPTGWQHIAMVMNNGTPSAYLNGTLVGTYAGANAIAPTGTTYIGGGMPSARNFNGGIDDVRVYNRPLSQAELQTIYNGGAR